MRTRSKRVAADEPPASQPAPSMRLAGYELDGHDNDTYMVVEDFPKSRNPDSPRHCPRCGYRLDFFPHNPAYRLGRRRRLAYPLGREGVYRRADLTATYDGQTIVTQAFKHFCQAQGYAGVEFLAFDNDRQHFHLLVSPVVAFDTERASTYFENRCEVCGNYESVVRPGSTLRAERPLGDGLYRSELLYASGNAKHPVLVVGVATREKMILAGLRGLEFRPLYFEE
jgi:hypothetical protein